MSSVRQVVTVGVFDGVHRGHQQLIARAASAAKAHSVDAVALTFDPHPTAVFAPARTPALITTLARRRELLLAAGADDVRVAPFTAEFADWAPERFVTETLVGDLGAVEVVVGANFTFGRAGAADANELTRLGREHGFVVDAVDLLPEHGRPISATGIRALIAEGDVSSARELLGHAYRCDGTVVRGEQRGRQLGYPTANIDFPPELIVPADGVYAGRVVRLNADGTARAAGRPLGTAAISVGTNPTFDATRRTVEAFILDFDADLYDQVLGVEFHHRLRGMEKFDSIEALIVQMDADVERTRELVAD